MFLNFRHGLLSSPQSIKRTALAFTTVMYRKARVLEAVASEMNALRRRLSPDDQQALNELSQTRALIAQMNSTGLGRRSLDDYQKELRELLEKEDRLQTAVSSRSAEFRIEDQAPTIQDLKAALPKNAAMIEFARYRPYRLKDARNRWDPAHYAVFVLLKDGQVA